MDIQDTQRILQSITQADIDSVEKPDEIDVAERRLSRQCELCAGGRPFGWREFLHSPECPIYHICSTRVYITGYDGVPTYHMTGWALLARLSPVILVKRQSIHKLLYCPESYFDKSGNIKVEYR